MGPWKTGAWYLTTLAILFSICIDKQFYMFSINWLSGQRSYKIYRFLVLSYHCLISHTFVAHVIEWIRSECLRIQNYDYHYIFQLTRDLKILHSQTFFSGFKDIWFLNKEICFLSVILNYALVVILFISLSVLLPLFLSFNQKISLYINMQFITEAQFSKGNYNSIPNFTLYYAYYALWHCPWRHSYSHKQIIGHNQLAKYEKSIKARLFILQISINLWLLRYELSILQCTVLPNITFSIIFPHSW